MPTKQECRIKESKVKPDKIHLCLVLGWLCPIPSITAGCKHAKSFKKEMSFYHKLKISNPNIFAT